MESVANSASSSSLALDAQALRKALSANALRAEEQAKLIESAQTTQIDRGLRSRMSEEILNVMTDAMNVMKKTGEEARNAGR